MTVTNTHLYTMVDNDKTIIWPLSNLKILIAYILNNYRFAYEIIFRFVQLPKLHNFSSTVQKFRYDINL